MKVMEVKSLKEINALKTNRKKKILNGYLGGYFTNSK